MAIDPTTLIRINRPVLGWSRQEAVLLVISEHNRMITRTLSIRRKPDQSIAEFREVQCAIIAQYKQLHKRACLYCGCARRDCLATARLRTLCIAV